MILNGIAKNGIEDLSIYYIVAKLVERYDHRHKELKDLYSSCLELVERKLELNAFGQVDLGSVFSIAQYKKKSK